MKSKPKPRRSCYAELSAGPSERAALLLLLRNTITNGNVYKRSREPGIWRAAMNSYRRERVATANAALAAAIEADSSSTTVRVRIQE